ncbi:MAG: chromosomal replication initiation protein DnaA, partial [Actinomycetia bacterium]|nr:chromosomal replication initiation protein DnaA [Actinomycetes bacterium]
RVVAVRQTAMAVLYHEFGMSLVEIGDALDRDHTTVLHGVRVADPDRVAALTAAVTA